MNTLTMSGAIAASNEQTAPEYRLVCPGLTINVHGDDITILDCEKRSERVIGDSYASWIVLIERDAAKHRDPFVVWGLIATPNGWELQHGTYCQTLEEGRKAFGQR